MKVTFLCPACDVPARVSLDQSCDWQCAACDHRLRIPATDVSLSACAVCGNPELYKKKDFPHWLGMSILVVALVLSVFSYYWYEKWLTWALLIGSAVIDGALYLMVGDVVVCYRCNAHHRGIKPTDTHLPFEITIDERYRQEKMRQERMKGKAN